jgi:hypothetical protein
MLSENILGSFTAASSDTALNNRQKVKAAKTLRFIQ